MVFSCQMPPNPPHWTFKTISKIFPIKKQVGKQRNDETGMTREDCTTSVPKLSMQERISPQEEAEVTAVLVVGCSSGGVVPGTVCRNDTTGEEIKEEAEKTEEDMKKRSKMG